MIVSLLLKEELIFDKHMIYSFNAICFHRIMS